MNTLLLTHARLARVPRTDRRLIRMGFLLAACALAVRTGAQFAIPWSTLDGGGGTSTGGVYAVRGTIGQPDAGGPMTGGPYAVTGGFWTLPVAVQMTNAPTLYIAPAAVNHFAVWWVPATPGWVLQHSSAVAAGWTNAPSGATNPVAIPAAEVRKFYRLTHP